MLIEIRLTLERSFIQQVEKLVDIFRSTVEDSGDFVWVNSKNFFIEIGTKECSFITCPRFYKDFEEKINLVQNWSFSLGTIKRGVSLYRSDMLYFSLGKESDVLRNFAVQLSKNLKVKIKHPFVPRITISYSKLNYGASALSNISAMIKTFNNQLLESDFNPNFKVESVELINKVNQKLLRKFLVN